MNIDRPECHSTDHLKETEVEKWTTFHPSRLGMTCAQPDQHGHCFMGNLGGTAERHCRAGM